MVGTLGQPWQVKLGSHYLSVVAGPDADGDQDPGYLTQFVTQDSQRTFESRDVVTTLNEFRRGAGFVRRRGTQDDGGLAWVENAFFHTDNGITPSGKLTGNANYAALAITGQVVVDTRAFNGDRYCLMSGTRVLRFDDDDPSGTPTYDPALNAFGTATSSIRSGYVLTAIEVFTMPVNASGGSAGLFNSAGVPVPVLLLAAYNASSNESRLYAYTALSGTWTESASAFSGVKITKLAGPVWWESRSTGAGANRLLATWDDYTIRHCPYGSDPLVEASWVAPIQIPSGYPITGLLCFPQFAYADTPVGLWTFNELRAMNVTPYRRLGASLSLARSASAIYGTGIATPRGFGIDYYDARQDYRRQDEVDEIGPAASFQDGTPIAACQITALAQYEDALLMAGYNHANDTLYIGRAYPRERIGADGPGRLVHYWAEQVQGPSAGPIGQQATKLVVSSPTVAGSTVVSARTVNLWIFTAQEPFDASATGSLLYAPLPTGSGPLSVQVSGGTFSFNQNAKAYLTQQNGGDDHSTLFVRRIDALGMLLDANRPMAVYTRTNRDPRSLADDSTWTLAGTVTSETPSAASITTANEVSGNPIGLKLILTSNSATTVPSVQSVSLRYKQVRESFRSLTLWVVLEKDHPTAIRTRDVRDPDTVLAAITALQDQGRQSYLPDTRVATAWQVLVEQGERIVRRYDGRFGWRSLLEITLTVVDD